MDAHYFPDASLWRNWLEENHASSAGVYLILYTVDHENDSMRWEEAVREALCFGWIDSTVKSLGNGKRQQYFCPRKQNSAWSKLNKTHIRELQAAGRMHPSGLARIREAKANGSWTALDDVENGVVPESLQAELERHPEALAFFEGLSRTYRKSYLYWLNQAKREETRATRILEIVRCLQAGKKSRTS